MTKRNLTRGEKIAVIVLLIVAVLGMPTSIDVTSEGLVLFNRSGGMRIASIYDYGIFLAIAVIIGLRVKRLFKDEVVETTNNSPTSSNNNSLDPEETRSHLMRYIAILLGVLLLFFILTWQEVDVVSDKRIHAYIVIGACAIALLRYIIHRRNA